MRKPKEAEIDIDRLIYAMQRSRWTLRYFREQRMEMVREYAGPHWSENAARKKVPLNLLALYSRIVGRSLIPNDPRVLLTTTDAPMRPMVKAMERWMNQEIVRTGLKTEYHRIMLDGLFSIGIAKVAIATPGDSATMAWTLQAGQPFLQHIDLDDWVYDVHARDFSQVAYMGHRVRVPRASIVESKLYSKARANLETSYDPFFNLEGDERINVLGRGYWSGNDEEFEDMVDLWEVYLPRHRVIVTLQDDSLTAASAMPIKDIKGGALRLQKWIGPDCGPYHIFAVDLVPGNAMPKAPLQDLWDLHEYANNHYRKLGRQGERQKEITVVGMGAMEDGDRIVKASDGEVVRSDNPGATTVVKFGGPDQGMALMAEKYKDLFDFMGGGLSLMGGMAPQSRTAAQDELLNQNGSATVQALQDKALSFVSSTLWALGWFWWHDPFHTMQTDYPLPGLGGRSIKRTISPQMRQAKRYEQVDLSVDPYSLQHQTPQQRMQFLTQAMTMLQPFMGLLQQQGIMIDTNFLVQKLAMYGNSPDLIELFTVAAPMQPQDAGGPPDTGGGPAATSREYIRRSVGNNTNANRANQFDKAMSAGASSGGQVQRAGQ